MIYPFGLSKSVLRSRYSRVMAAVLSVLLVLVTTFVVPNIVQATDHQPELPKVLIFPFTNTSTVTTDSDGKSLSTLIASNVRLDIDALGFYHSTGFSVLNPSIQRDLNVEGSISLADLQAPTATADRAQKLAAITGTPYFITAQIDAVNTDPATGIVTITVEGSFYKTATGEVIKQATVTGTAAPVTKEVDPDALLATAIANSSGQLVAGLVAPRIVHSGIDGSAVPKQRLGSSYGKGLLYILAAGLALVVIHNHGGGGHSGSNTGTSSTTGGTTTGGPPPPP